MMKRITVYCGSCMGSRPAYRLAAEELGRTLAARGIGLVYGGGNVGLMGALADAALREGGEVIGVIPRFLEQKEVAHRKVKQLMIVDTMHQRKTIMAELADGFIAMPGGLGTLEEWFEMMTWAQLGQHHKPCALLNVEGYYDPLMAALVHGCQERFIKREYFDMVICDRGIPALLEKMEEYIAPKLEKWLDMERV